MDENPKLRHELPRVLRLLGGRRGLALATIIDAEGSTPQVPGASAVYSGSGLLAGTVGGGLLEARTGQAAAETLADGRARLVEFRLDADPSDMEGAICGGAATVLVDPVSGPARTAFRRALDGLAARRRGLLLTTITRKDGPLAAAERTWLSQDEDLRVAPRPDTQIPAEELEAVMASGIPRLFRLEDRVLFAEPILPLPRLIIAGAGHVGRALAHLGRRLDFEVTVIDDRAEFANRDNVPDADAIVVDDPAAALGRIPDAKDNYFVIVTRGHRNDAQALRACLGRQSAYVGMIGSRTKVDLMRQEFLGKGWATEEDWSRLHAPIGLDIKSKTVEEIAVSIAAELVLVRAAGKAGP